MGRAKWKSWIGLALSLLFLGLALRHVEWTGVWSAWRAARLDSLGLGAALLAGSWVVVAWRSRTLLSSVAGLRIRDTFAYVAIGFLANTVLPLRLGDLARASLLGRKKNAGISRALGSIVVERLMDVLMLVALTLALMLVLDVPAAIQAGLGSLLAVALVALAGLMLVSLNRARLPRLAAGLARIMPPRLADRLLTLMANFSSGAEVLHRPLGFLAIVGLSVTVWLAAGLGTLAWVRAFHLPVPWYAGFFVLVVVNLGTAIPSSPGYVGVYHYLAVLALSMWTPDRNAALAYAIGTHALNMLLNVGFGSFFLTREGLSLRDFQGQFGRPLAEAEVRSA